MINILKIFEVLRKEKFLVIFCFIAFFILSVIPSGCSGGGYARLLRGDSDKSGYGSVRGKILCVDNIDFTSVDIVINDTIELAHIDPEGMYRVDDLSSGTIRIKAVDSSYQSWKEYVTIIKDKTVNGPELVLFEEPPLPPFSTDNGN